MAKDPKSPRSIELGKFIKRHRVWYDIEKEDLATAAGISAASITAIEGGYGNIITNPDTLELIAEKIHADAGELIRLAGIMDPEVKTMYFQDPDQFMKTLRMHFKPRSKELQKRAISVPPSV